MQDCDKFKPQGLANAKELREWLEAHTCNNSYSRSRDRWIVAWVQPWQKHKTLPKQQTKRKRTGCVPQALEHLSRMFEVLCSILGTAKFNQSAN
jgi:hypothetical protein